MSAIEDIARRVLSNQRPTSSAVILLIEDIARKVLGEQTCEVPNMTTSEYMNAYEVLDNSKNKCKKKSKVAAAIKDIARKLLPGESENQPASADVGNTDHKQTTTGPVSRGPTQSRFKSGHVITIKDEPFASRRKKAKGRAKSLPTEVKHNENDHEGQKQYMYQNKHVSTLNSDLKSSNNAQRNILKKKKKTRKKKVGSKKKKVINDKPSWDISAQCPSRDTKQNLEVSTDKTEVEVFVCPGEENDDDECTGLGVWGCDIGSGLDRVHRDENEAAATCSVADNITVIDDGVASVLATAEETEDGDKPETHGGCFSGTRYFFRKLFRRK